MLEDKRTGRAKRRRSREMSNDKKLLLSLRLGEQNVRGRVILGGHSRIQAPGNWGEVQPRCCWWLWEGETGASDSKKAPPSPQIVFFLPFSFPSPFGRPYLTGTNGQRSLGNVVCRVPAPESRMEPMGGLRAKKQQGDEGPPCSGWHWGGVPEKEEQKGPGRTDLPLSMAALH